MSTMGRSPCSRKTEFMYSCNSWQRKSWSLVLKENLKFGKISTFFLNARIFKVSVNVSKRSSKRACPKTLLQRRSEQLRIPLTYSEDVSKPLDLLQTSPALEDLDLTPLRRPFNLFAPPAKQIFNCARYCWSALGGRISLQTVRNRLKHCGLKAWYHTKERTNRSAQGYSLVMSLALV